MRTRLAIFLSFVYLVAPIAAAAQDEPLAPDANARVHVGPLALNPTIGLTNVGVNTNVFYEPDPAHPKSDFTMTLEPASDFWLHMGRSYFSGNVKEDLVYFQKYADQRSANNFDTLTYTMPFNRLTLKAGGTYANTNDPPGYEIAARIHHVDKGVNGAAELNVFSKTFVGVRGSRTTYSYDPNAQYFDTSLAQELNRTTTIGALTVRNKLTPLTSLTLDVSREQDRFEFNSGSDSDSTQITGGVRFDPFALIKGGATIGYQKFTPLNPTIPAFSGLTAAVDLSYVAFGSTKLGVTASRGVQYSYLITQPYYLQTTFGGSLAQQVYGPFDVVVNGNVATLSYRDELGVIVPYPNEVDRVYTYGGGAGYHLGSNARIGFNVNEQKRTSPNPLFQYHGLIAGMSVTYGY